MRALRTTRNLRHLTLASFLLVVFVQYSRADYTVTGRFQYQDREFGLDGFTGTITPRPIRFAEVRIMAGAGTLATGSTSLEGSFLIQVPGSVAQQVTAVCVSLAPKSSAMLLSVRVAKDDYTLGDYYAVASLPVAYWLGQLLFYGVHRLGGVELLLLVQSIVLTAAYSGLLWLCVQTSGRPKLAASVLILTVIPFSMGNWHLRPQSFAVPLFAAFLIVIDAYKRGRRAPLYVLPLLIVPWVHIHGSFVLGLVLIGAAVLGELLDRRFGRRTVADEAPPRVALAPLVGWGIAAAAATLVNPRGPLRE